MRRALTTILASLLLCGAATAGEGEAPEISATVNPAKATVGSILEYRVTVTGKGFPVPAIAPPEAREFFPEPKTGTPKPGGDKAPSDFVPLWVIHSIKKDDRSDGGMTDITVTMQVSFYRPGTWALPDLEIMGDDGIRIGYRAPEVEIAASNEKGEFQEIEPPLDLKGNHRRLVLLLLAAAALGAAAFFAWRKIRKRLEERRSAPVIIPPIDTFLKEIEAFGGAALIESGRVEEFVFGISMIFRKFLSSQFRFDATEMTSHEIERKIRKAIPRALHARCRDGIMDNLNLWDLSKFAEFTPPKERLHASLAITIELAGILSGGTGDDLPGV